jgi:NitT/TauT family transport system ATP-binding protein
LHLVDTIYKVMTNPKRSAQDILRDANTPDTFGHLPHARAEGIAALLEVLQDRGGKPENLYEVAQALQFSTDDILPIADAALLLNFVTINEGDIALTEQGSAFATADILTRKQFFRDSVLTDAPLARKIHECLVNQARHVLPEEFFEDILDEHFTREETERQMDGY